MVTTVTNNSPQAINTSLFSLQKEIDDLRRQINQINNKNDKDTAELAKGLVPGGEAGQVYTSNGSGSPSWQDAKGEKGDQGPQGPQGIQGPQGPKGDMPDVSGLATKASVEAIKQLIPDTTTPENQLADKGFVNGEISSVNSEIDNKLSSKANGNGNVFFRSITPRQMATIDEMKSIVRSYPVGSIILFQTTWDEYTSFNFAGYNGYIIITGGSAYAYGLCRVYGENGWSRAIKFIDSPENCSGWYSL